MTARTRNTRHPTASVPDSGVAATSRAILSRRQVLGTVAGGLLAGLGTRPASGGAAGSVAEEASLPSLQGTPPSPAPAGVRTRANVYNLTDDQVASLRRGVAEMRRRPADEPTSWLFQANLHAIPALPAENLWCQHSSWYFLPWHRIYLYWFERILRDAAGDPGLTLPYWNYSDDPAQRFLPEPFRGETDATGAPNALYEARRAPALNAGDIGLSDGAVDYSEAFARLNFFVDGVGTSFGGHRAAGAAHGGRGAGDLEVTPHGDIHVEVGRVAGRVNVEVTFPGPGVFDYHCSLHPGQMQGRVTIVASGTPPLPRRSIDIVDGAYFPTNLTIPVGTTVRWTNLGAEPHSVTATNPAVGFDSGALVPAGIMAMPKLAARDPIFWLHHANVDRLWKRWLEQPGRANPIDQTDWMDQPFRFYNEQGAEVFMTPGEVLQTERDLHYRYDDDPAPVPEPPAATPAFVRAAGAEAREVTVLGESDPNQPVVVGAEPLTTRIPVDAPALDVLERMTEVLATPTTEGEAPQVVLALENMDYGGEQIETIEVYVNLPDDGVPDRGSEAFVGSVYVFGLFLAGDEHGGSEGANQAFDVSTAVRASRERSAREGDVAITFVPRGAVQVEASGTATPAAAEATPIIASPTGPQLRIGRVALLAVE